MKAIHCLIYTLILFSCTLSSCNDHGEVLPESFACSEPIDLTCNTPIEKDSLKLADGLIGTWQWEYSFWYSWIEPVGATTDCSVHKGLTLTFYSDATLEIKQDGQVIETAQWSINNYNNERFWIATSSSSGVLIGSISVCENRLVFGNSAADGIDNYFSRIN